MKRYDVQLAPAAETDISEAYRWYQERNAIAADAFRAEVLEVIDRLVEAPERWAADDHGHRRRVLRRFPYTVWFDVQGQTVTVLAVAHHRRMPGYWREPPN